MSAPVTPAPESLATPPLSEAARITNVFFAPSRTFQDIRRSAKFWGPLVVMIIFSYLGAFALQQKVGFEALSESIYNNMSEKQKERIEQAPPEQQQAIRARIASTSKFFSFAGWLLFFVIGAIIATVLMGTFNFGLGKSVTYAQSLAIVLYSFLPGLIKSVLFIITLFLGVDMESFNIENPVATNPAFWMNKGDAPALYVVAQTFDIFTIWQAVLMGIGFAVLARTKKSTGIAVVLGWLALVTLVKAGFAAAF